LRLISVGKFSLRFQFSERFFCCFCPKTLATRGTVSVPFHAVVTRRFWSAALAYRSTSARDLWPVDLVRAATDIGEHPHCRFA
jgi:hypothetical protein